MALNSLKVMTSVVRGRIGEPIEKKFTNPEIHIYINLGAVEVARRLLSINRELFAAREELIPVTPIGAGPSLADLPTDCLHIEAIVNSDYKPFTRLPLSDMGLVGNNSCFTVSTKNPYYIQVSDSQVAVWGNTSPIYLYYIRRPVELEDDDDVSIIPIQYIGMVIAYAVWQCADKAGLNVQVKEKEYDEMFRELERREVRDVKVNTPGDMKKE